MESKDTPPPAPEGDNPDPSTKDSAGEAYKHLEHLCKGYLDEAMLQQLHLAYSFAHALHEGQRRRSGEPYIVHPLSVASILAEFQMDCTTLTAAILHDVVEDTQVSVEEVQNRFGAPVAQIVDGLTKLAKVEFRSNQERMAENFRKMILATAKDIRVILVKLADRTHNMRTIRALDLERRQRIAEETLEIYAPLAGRLGIYRIKAELEDLCLKELKPSVYFSLVQRVNQKKAEREQVVERTRQCVASRLEELGVKGEVQGRAKHFYSIYKKMTQRKLEFEDIYDLFALRVIVGTVSECYETLGHIHSLFKPVPGRFKDYIAMPKANLYQSLHTTVIAAKGELLEIQIRTAEMNTVAENGIASHWAYKERVPKEVDPAEAAKFSWLRQMLKHQRELSDPDEFLEAVKVDLFDEDVYVFSPNGDVFELQVGATSLDFAFAVHSDLGLRTTGAKINGRLCPLRTKLRSGDVVEVLSGQQIRATKDWLGIVATGKARSRIRAYLRSKEREELRRTGQILLEGAFHKRGLAWEKAIKMGLLQDVNRFFAVGGLDDLVLQVGMGKWEALAVADKVLAQVPELAQSQPPIPQEAVLFSPPKRRKNRTSSALEDAVQVQGLSGLVVRLARCCEPLPGQPIVGFVSRGHVVAVHGAQCPWALANDPARRVECSWNKNTTGDQAVRLRISTRDKPGMLAEITKMISHVGINISGAEAMTTPDRRGVISLKIQVSSLRQLNDVHQMIESLDGVISVDRVMG